MDYFDLDYLNNYVNKYKKKLINKIPKIQFKPDILAKQKDILNQVLEYSPNVRGYSIKESKKIPLKNNKNNNIINKNIINTINNSDNKLNNNINIINNININKESNKNNVKRKNENEKLKEDTMNFNSSSDEEDEEYEKLMLKRQAQMEQKLKKNSEEDNITIKVYLLNTISSHVFQLKSSETCLDLKQRIINYINDKNLFSLKYNSPNAYDIRLTEEDEELPNMNISPLKNDINLFNFNDKNLSFIENADYKDKSKLGMRKNTGVLKNDSSADIHLYNPKKYNIRVYYKDRKNNNNMNINEIELNCNDHIKDILNVLIQKNIISCQNKDAYYFTEHNKDNNEKNLLNYDLSVQSLNAYELDLNLKNGFNDDDSDNNIINNFNVINNDEDDDNKEYVFNPILAGKYQEFEVIKINKLKTKQERILGIDLYNIYNNKPKSNKNELLLKKIFKDNQTKTPLRKIKDVNDCAIMGDKKFYIEFKSEDKKTKKIYYEVKNNNIRNEIIAKIKFLMNLNNDN